LKFVRVFEQGIFVKTFLYIEFIRSKIYQNLETEVSMNRVIVAFSILYPSSGSPCDTYTWDQFECFYGSYTMSHIFKKI